MVAEDHEVILTAAQQNPRAIRHAGKALHNYPLSIYYEPLYPFRVHFVLRVTMYGRISGLGFRV